MNTARARLEETAERRGFVGVALAVVRRGQPPSFECFGNADLAQGRPVDQNTVFRICSVSKTMTAVGVLQLRDRGLLGLDDPVNDHLRTFTVDAPAGCRPVTIRNLLTHTSGIGEMPRVSSLFQRSNWGMGPPGSPEADLGALFGGSLPTEVEAGTKWAYANYAFAILGQLVADVSGESFPDYMRAHLFDRLGMTSSDYVRSDRNREAIATGYIRAAGRLRPVRDYDFTFLGPGGVLSSIADMAAYAQWIVDGGPGAALRPGTFAEMTALQYSVDPRIDAGMGLGFWLGTCAGRRVVGHDGDNPGAGSALWVAPADGVGVVVLTNTSTLFGPHALADEVLRSAIGAPDGPSELRASEVGARSDVAKEVAGHYAPAPGFLTNFRSWQTFGGEIQVLEHDGELVLRALSPLRALRQGLVLRAIDPGDDLRFGFEFLGTTGEVAFARDAEGRVDRIAIGPPVNRVFHRRRAARSIRVRWRAAAAGAAAVISARAVVRGWKKRTSHGP